MSMKILALNAGSNTLRYKLIEMPGTGLSRDR
jgi:acetate kinase